ncbi:DUF4388 domain-containing protein [Desulfobacterales bacterium HSG2]|nr:DUF4388 domain-containing protein [Desulfobacterales bacterium HSG2]
MSFPEASVEIVSTDKCPLYEAGDEFELSGKAASSLLHKPVCLILAGNILSVLTKSEDMDSDLKSVFYCSGCIGLVRFEYKKRDLTSLIGKPDGMSDVVSLLRGFSIFSQLNENEIRDIVSFLRLDKFDKGDIILRKGEPGKKLFIIVAGRVEVLGDAGVRIAFLEKGEVFGEMSLLSGEPVAATIRVVEPSKVLYLNGEYFRKFLNRFSSLQIYLARLLAQRLAKTNVAKFEEFASGMVGKLSEIPPTGLFQTLNLNQKTGVLILKLPEGSAILVFRDGEIIRAKHNKKRGREAFFELLKENEGHFKFIPGLSEEEMKTPPLGEFMGLLMEGVRRLDESNIG